MKNSRDIIHVLIIEDELPFQLQMKSLLNEYEKFKFNITFASTYEESKEKLSSIKFDLLFIDITLHGESKGFELVELAKARQQGHTLLLTSHSSKDYINRGYKSGCDGYLIKPFTEESLNEVMIDFYKYKKDPQVQAYIENFYLTQDKSTKNELKKVKSNYADSLPVLIMGPTGIGKSYLAKIFHELHPSSKKILEVNCASFPDDLLESELFGHVAGAFTDAKKSKKGLLELAHDGTIFLDEIGEMSLKNQKKLLKALEEKEFRPIGSEKTVKSNFRIICATNKNLIEQIQKKQFRQDLYFRIAQVVIQLPALSSRKIDIKLWIEHFLDQKSQKRQVSEEAMQLLYSYNWPGNIRQIKNTIDYIYKRRKKIAGIDDLPTEISQFKNGKQYTAYDILSENQCYFIDEHTAKEFLKKIQYEVFKYTYIKNNGKTRKTIADLDTNNYAFYNFKKEFTKENEYYAKPR